MFPLPWISRQTHAVDFDVSRILKGYKSEGGERGWEGVYYMKSKEGRRAGKRERKEEREGNWNKFDGEDVESSQRVVLLR